MIRLFFDREGNREIKESIDMGEAFPKEIKEIPIYAIADTDTRDMSIQLKNSDGQISVTPIPVEMKKNQIWEGRIIWKAGESPPQNKPSLELRGTEILEW